MFDFLKGKTKDKDPGRSLDEKPGKSKKAEKVGAIDGFEAQEKALEPEENKKGKGGGGPLKALKQAFGMGGKGGKESKAADASLFPKVDAILFAAAASASNVMAMTWQLQNVQNEVKEGAHAGPKYASMLEKVAEGRVAGMKFQAAEQGFSAAIKDWKQNGGSLAKAQAAITLMLRYAAQVHTALYGHAGPEDFKTEEGILYNPILPDDGIKGGRSMTSDEKLHHRDGRSGKDGEYKHARLPESKEVGGVSMGKAIYKRAPEWAGNYKALVDAIMDLGVVL